MGFSGTGFTGIAGSGTLSGGTAVITSSQVKATSHVYLTDTSNGANEGTLSVGTITPGTSFAVNSSNASDANTFNYLLIP